ncbi:MAG: excinuclease ABC subunit UvrC [Chloroflexota bacterium]|nr:excinuclease ABC subunit UvrC [Chloroflexota bacterium]MDE2941842.1 excinuclease ABC subunit UvrC [Chloroflexota bacterium]MDE3268314.1 excinuclease ABC subunit UvrC [Chloroflexota bacterium]
MPSPSIAKQLRATPVQPGVYLLKDAQGQVLYVGKAASLRHRLQSYFGSPVNLEPKIRNMVAGVTDFEFIVTDTEAEALILENTFIKSRRPKYNARLKDDKTYPYLKIGLNEEFPQVYVTRRVTNDGARYFGPYASAGSVRKTMALLKKLFPYRSCTREIRGDDPRPCLEYYINRCVAPCIGAASREEYGKVIDQVVMFMEGRTEAVVRDLRGKMEDAAEAWEFERASRLRDQLRAIERVTEGQKVVSLSGQDEDVIAMARGGDEAWVEVFFVRGGKLIGREHFVMGGVQDDAPERVMADFVKQYYDRAPHVPPRLLLQHSPEDADPIREWLEQKRGRKVELRTPQRGEKRRLVEMVAENAGQRMEQFKVKWLADEDALESAMEELQEGLNLPRLPLRMECYDISNIQGTTPVGSMVVFENGQAKSSHYRRFKIRSVDGIDDYAMMQEMLRRRFQRLGQRAAQSDDEAPPDDGAAQGGSWGILPDLVLIDGGKGHLNAAVEVFLELGIDDVPLASLAKEHEEIFVRDMQESIMLPRSSPALFLVQRLRDEAHRFAVTYHQRSRTRKGLRSAIDVVPGIGPKRRRMLIRRFGSVKGVKDASTDELAAVPGMTRTLAERIKDYL